MLYMYNLLSSARRMQPKKISTSRAHINKHEFIYPELSKSFINAKTLTLLNDAFIERGYFQRSSYLKATCFIPFAYLNKLDMQELYRLKSTKCQMNWYSFSTLLNQMMKSLYIGLWHFTSSLKMETLLSIYRI